MAKKCEVCGKFMHQKLHGACFKCLRNTKFLPPALKELSDKFDVGGFTGSDKKSVRGIIRSVLTVVHDDNWYAVQWNPMSNIVKVIETRAERSYLTDEMIEELEQICAEAIAEDMKGE